MNIKIIVEAYKQLEMLHNDCIENAIHEAEEILADQLDIERDDLLEIIEEYHGIEKITPQLAEKIDQLYDNEYEKPKREQEMMFKRYNQLI